LAVRKHFICLGVSVGILLASSPSHSQERPDPGLDRSVRSLQQVLDRLPLPPAMQRAPEGITRERTETPVLSARALARLSISIPRPRPMTQAVAVRRHTGIGAAYNAEIDAAARRYGIPPRFLRAIVEIESNFDPHALSPKGARGLAQIMPATARAIGVDPSQLWEPTINLDAAARLIRELAMRYRGNIDAILVAYNAGIGVADSLGVRPIPQETKLYAVLVEAAYRSHAPSP
jgi:soluble lytic murein transglycosylase-like protein